MSDLPFGGRVSVDGGVQSITLIHGSSSLLPRVVAIQSPFRHSAFPFASPLYCHITYLGRQADRRTLKPCSQRAFPIFHLPEVPGGENQVRDPCAFLPSFLPSFLPAQPCRNKTAATERIDASRCKFVLFFTAGHLAAAFASPRLASLRLVVAGPC